MKIYLEKEKIKDYNPTELAVYTALKTIVKEDTKEYYVSVNQICFILLGHCNASRRFKQSITDSINSITDITILDNVSSTEWLVDLSRLYFKDKYFVTVELSTVRKIFNIDTKSNNLAIFKAFIFIIGTINLNEGVYDGIDMVTNIVGYMPIDYLVKISSISKSALLDYTDILEKNKILYVYRHNKFITDDSGQIKSICNHYGLYENKEFIFKFAEQYEETLGITPDTVIKKKASANTNRRYSQIYNSMVNGKTYDKDTINEVYKYIHTQNEILKKKELFDKVKDESIFTLLID